MTREQKQLLAAISLPEVKRIITTAMDVVTVCGGHTGVGPRGAALHALGLALDALDIALPEPAE